MPGVPVTPSIKDVAFVYPGQGSQYAGMGKTLAAAFPEARLTFDEADNALNFSLSRLCFEGPEEDLKLTENTQPALLATSVAAHRVLEANGYAPVMVAGHSLGEYSALVAAGALSFPDALRLVRKRGQYMQDAVPQGQGAMAALLKLAPEKLPSILEQAAQGEVVSAANLNSPDQTVIAGHVAAVERAMELAKAAGAKRAIRLAVSAPFHCSLMRPAQVRLEPDLTSTSFQELAVPLINNWEARLTANPDEARRGLYEQIPNPVRWTETILAMYHSGIRRIVEVGPGSVLLGLIRTISPAIAGAKFGEAADFDGIRRLLV